jgi:hypothetical protein
MLFMDQKHHTAPFLTDSNENYSYKKLDLNLVSTSKKQYHYEVNLPAIQCDYQGKLTVQVLSWSPISSLDVSGHPV